jgi:hypothetical protein
LRYEVKKALVCTREKLREEMREMRGGWGGGSALMI